MLVLGFFNERCYDYTQSVLPTENKLLKIHVCRSINTGKQLKGGGNLGSLHVHYMYMYL